MQTQTLAELRAENAKLEGKEPEETPTEGNEPEQLAAEEEAQALDQAGEPGEESGGEPSVEAWMQTEEQGSDDGDVPLATHISVRSKLKDKVKERDHEIEQLKAQVQQLQGGMAPGQPSQPTYPPANTQPPTGAPMPRIEDFEHDADKHAAAVHQWQLSQMQAMQQAQQQQWQQQQAQQQRQAVIDAQVNSHYERAQELTAKAGIKPELYQAADLAVRQAADAVAPGQGDAIVDDIIARLGPGSEKVMYYLGKNPSQQALLQQKLRNDPYEAMAYMGELKATLTAPAKRKSNAPKPAARVTGGGTAGADDENRLKRKYKAAKSDQERFQISREAKKAGFNSVGW